MLGDDYAPLLLGVSWTFTCLSSVFVFARFFCRLGCHIKIGWDDFWAAFSLAMSFAMSISWTVYARLGGTLDAPLAYHDTVKINFVSWLSQTWCITAIITTKIAVAALIKRLQGPSKWRTRVLWFLCSVSAAWAVIQIAFVWGRCRPTATLWDPLGNPNGKCWSPKVVVYNGMACSSFWAFTDIALALLPVHMVMKLKMALRRRLAICALLSTGIFAAAMAIVRTTKLPADLQKNSDVVHQYVMFFIWNILEINSLIISSCVPTLMPLYDRARRRASPQYKTGGSTSRNTLDGRHSLNVFSRRKGPRHRSFDRQNISSQVYINLDKNGNGTGFGEGRDNRYTASVSAPGNINEAEQGIRMSRELDISRSRPKASTSS